MNRFMHSDFNINKVDLALYVTPHNSKTVIVEKNEIVYLPKESSYKVLGTERNLCYAINFDISEDVSFESFSFKPKNSTKFLDRFKSAEQA